MQNHELSHDAGAIGNSFLFQSTAACQASAQTTIKAKHTKTVGLSS